MNTILTFLKKIQIFLNEVKAEIRKITWPSREDLIGTVIIVCFLTAVFAVLLGAMDLGFSALIKKLIS